MYEISPVLGRQSIRISGCLEGEVMSPFFSVVTATYNRANLIHRVFESLMCQTYQNFEWVVIDDGSTDDTDVVIKNFVDQSFFHIKYVRIENGGKANALNSSLQHCEGILYLVLDSDDWCDADALEVLFNEYSSLDENERCQYFALSCLKRYQDGRVVGDDYSNLNKYGSTYIDRLNKNVKGDKWECLVFDKVRDCLYPLAANEKYMAPGYVWLKMAELGYMTVFINKSLSVIEYRSDGISLNNIKHRLSSLGNTIRYYKEFAKLRGATYWVRGRYYANYVRFSTHARLFPEFSMSLFPFAFVGLLLYLFDRARPR